MDILRGRTIPSRKQASSVNSCSDNSTSKSSNAVSKPLSAMSFDELLNTLPELKASMVKWMWIPEMRKKHDAMMRLLQKSEEHTLVSNQRLGRSLQKFQTLSERTKQVTNAYQMAVVSAESLVERDSIRCQEQLHASRKKVGDLQMMHEQIKKDIVDRDETIGYLQNTIDEVIRILGSFIQKHVADWVEDYHNDDTQAVVEIIAGYRQFGVDGNKQSSRHICIPEDVHLGRQAALRDAETQIHAYEDMISDQNEVIRDQSAQLDHQLGKYETCIKLAQERHHEVVLLTQRKRDLEKKVEECEDIAHQKHNATVERDRAQQERDDLRQELSKATDWFTSQIQDRDRQLAQARQELGAAREEVLARQADVRNVISQTQAMLDPKHAAEMLSSDPSKAHQVLGKPGGKKKERRQFPRAAWNGGFAPLSPDMITPLRESKLSNKKSASTQASDSPRRSSRASTSTSNSRSDTASIVQSSDPFVELRPRIGALEHHGSLRRSQASQTNGHTLKSLPAPPAQPTPMDDDPASSAFRTPARRVLSLIPEGSQEDAASMRTPSATSSEKEVYRRSIHALSMLNESGAEGHEPREDPVGDGSEIAIVSSLYHSNRRHL